MNQLQYEKSPYLLQHAENPVDWRPWGTAAFQAAQQEDKPIFLSIGYSTCHWCHVMAHESFESEVVAEILNRFFIPIKVDREERPDVDSVYMAACIAINGSGGWPLTVLLTPKQEPFWAGTYLPKAQLLSLLDRTVRLWREDREKLLASGEMITHYLQQEEIPEPYTPSRAVVEAGVLAFSELFDRRWGGFGHAPKFPSAHNLLFLLGYACRTGDSNAQNMAEFTLECMYRGGLFDHVGGGFSRYSTDPMWLVPHFEKMLYDNALLALTYTEAFRQTKRQYYRYVTRRTLDYMCSELINPFGGFICGQDADSDGIEGKYYVFSPEELSEVLGKDAAEDFCQTFHITSQGNFHGKSVLNLIDTPDWERIPERMGNLLSSVSRYRNTRTHLQRDDKVLTAWNGLAIAALSKAGLIFEEPRYLQAGIRAADFIRRYLTNQSGRLLARWRRGEAAYSGKLEDYAFYIWGLLELYASTFRIDYLEEACRLTDSMLKLFFDSEHGGFYPYASDGEQLITRTKEIYDGAMPSGNAVAALVLSRLGRLTGEQTWREAAEIQFRYLSGAIRDNLIGHSFTLLALLEEVWPTEELISTAKELPEELFQFLRETPKFGLTVLVKTEETNSTLAKIAPFTAAYPISSAGAQYYLCQNGVCKRPTTKIEELS